MPAAAFTFRDLIAGDRWAVPLRWTNPDGTGINLAGYTARMQIAHSGGTLTLTHQAGSAQNSTGLWVPDQSVVDNRGRITIVVLSADTTTIPAGEWPYDLQVAVGGEPSTLLRGTVRVTGQVTT